ncbi:MAG: hypothetical protein BroJett015_24650 [Chloroflexota bacterium]|nr:MAG: hypothetical protein BroJett015_24650 [Chloroflexota bacterium]
MGAVWAGGWAVLTLESWPENVVAGEPFTVRYALRQHGNHLISRIEGTVTAVHTETGERLQFTATDTDETGYYEATLLLPAAGEWRWYIDSFGRFEMPPLPVETGMAVPAAAAAPMIWLAKLTSFPWLLGFMGVVVVGTAVGLWRRQQTRFAPVAALLGVTLCLAGFVVTPAVGMVASETAVPPTAEWGEILFVAKGCVTCHQHDDVAYNGIRTDMGPNLSHHQVGAEFLQLWLRHPAQVRPQTLMPNLELSDREIEALIVFLSGDGETGVKETAVK